NQQQSHEFNNSFFSNDYNQEFILSYLQHLIVRRNIKNPFENKENYQINNYIDLGMEVIYKNNTSQQHLSSSSSSSASSTLSQSLRFGASWQINKNNLIKFRIDSNNISACYAIKSWFDPAATGSICIHQNFNNLNQFPSIGLSFSLENMGDILFSKPNK